MILPDVKNRLNRLMNAAASDRDNLRHIIFTVVIIFSALASLFIVFGGQDTFSSPVRLWPIRWMMLGWAMLHIPFYLFSRGRHSQSAYLAYSCGAFVILSVLYQTSNALLIVSITTEISQVHTLLFLSLLLLPIRLFIIFSSAVCFISLSWIQMMSGSLDRVHGREASTAISFIVVAMWFITSLAAILLESYYRQITRAHAELHGLNKRLRKDVEAQSGLIQKHQENTAEMQKMNAIGLLAGGIAHDFNNKLTIVRGFGELISDKAEPGSEMSGWIRNILAASGEASIMTRQLLSFSRREMINPRSVNLNTAVETRCEVFRHLLGENIRLIVALEPELGNCMFDPGQLEEVIVNLIINARDAMGNGGQLEIRTENIALMQEFVEMHPDAKPGPHVCLTVKDTGSGMTPEILSHLFEPFFTTKPKGKGTGLGLATVYGTVKQNGGLIDVESRLGEGSSFRIYLPQVAEVVFKEELKPKPFISRNASATILVVEDEIHLLELIREVLSKAGFRVITARGPHEAILKSREEKGDIHLVLSDVIMAEGGAGRTVLEISAHRPGIPVLYMSGYADETIAAHGILDREKNFLRKPFTPTDLLEKIGDILSKSTAK